MAPWLNTGQHWGYNIRKISSTFKRLCVLGTKYFRVVLSCSIIGLIIKREHRVVFVVEREGGREEGPGCAWSVLLWSDRAEMVETLLPRSAGHLSLSLSLLVASPLGNLQTSYCWGRPTNGRTVWWRASQWEASLGGGRWGAAGLRWGVSLLLAVVVISTVAHRSDLCNYCDQLGPGTTMR